MTNQAPTVSPAPRHPRSPRQMPPRRFAEVAPPGLKGLIVTDTTIGGVRGDEGFFHYRSENAAALAVNHTFAEVAARLLGDDGSTSAGAQLRSRLGRGRTLPARASALLEPIVASTPRMLDALSAALTCVIDNAPVIDLTTDERRARLESAIAIAPVVLAALWRTRNGQQPLAPDADASPPADYLRLLTGRTPTDAEVDALRAYWVLTMDHGLNASTFTARVVTSTGAGVASALSAALGALSGPLHGGAPSRVLDMLNVIGDAENTERYAHDALRSGAKIMGFGHAVYRTDDPRSVHLRRVAQTLATPRTQQALDVEARMLRVLREAKPNARLVTNVEFYAAVVLEAIGIPPEMFTPTFAASRLVGWSAHILEQAENSRIMRPKARYVGPAVSDAPTASAAD